MSVNKNNISKDNILEVYINKMHCVNCVNNIKSKITKYKEKVNFFDIDLNSSKLFISLKDDKILDYIKNDIENLGYKFEVLNNNINNKENEFKINKRFFFDKEFLFVLFINFLSFFIFVISMFFHNLMISNRSILLLIFILSSIVYISGGYRFLRNSYFAIKNKILNMDVLIALSTTAAYFYSVYNFF